LQAIHYEFRRYARVIRACEDREPGLLDKQNVTLQSSAVTFV